MSSRSAPVIPSVLDICDFCPRVRRHARRTLANVRQLANAVAMAFPDAVLLARDPSAADRIETTYHEHVAADLYRAARALGDVISALDESP